MTPRIYALVSGVLFALVALAHLWRIATGAVIVIAAETVPVWVSWLGIVIPGILAYYGLRYGSR